MKKILATGATQNYLSVISPYLTTISVHSNFDVNILVALDCDAVTPVNVKVARLSNSDVAIKHSNNCLQHGEFMRAEAFAAFSDEDIVCFTDGDLLMQRPLSEAEVSLLESLGDNDVLVQFNTGRDDNLLDEYHRLQPGLPHHHLESLLGLDLRSLSCFNTGVLVCNKRTWGEIFRLYAKYSPLVKEHADFGHYAGQQWILSLILGLHMKVKIMDHTFHTHFHYGRVPGSRFKGNVHMHDGQEVLFSHYSVRDGLPISKQGFAVHQREYLRFHISWLRHFRFLHWRF